MISAVNSARFASANNYKRTYTNTNQNINQNGVGYQQSFGAAKATKATSILLGLAIAAIEAISPAQIAKAAVDDAAAIAAKKAGKPKGIMQLMPDAKKAEKCRINLNPVSKLEEKLIPIPTSLRAKVDASTDAFNATMNF